MPTYTSTFIFETIGNDDELRELVGMPTHQEAKRLHERWIGPYRVVLGEVMSTYGTPGLGLDHVPPARPDSPQD